MRFGDLPIRRKVTLVAVLIPGIAVVFAGTGVLLVLQRSFEQSARAELTTLADVVALAVDAAMTGIEPSPEDAARGLEAVRVRTDIDEAHLFSVPGSTLFASAPADSVPPAELARAEPGIYESERGLWLVAPLRDDRNRLVGRIALHSSLATLRRERERAVQALALIAVGVLGVALLAATMLTRSLVRPVMGVAAAVRRIESSRDNSLRAPVGAGDEIGELSGSINRMLAALEEQATALRQGEERLRTLLESLPVAVVLLDPDAGHFVQINDAACGLYGLDRARLLELGPMDVSPPKQADGRPSVEAGVGYIRQALAGERPRFEWIHRDAAEREVFCDISLVALDVGPKRLVCGIMVDMSERRQLEAQLRQSQKLEALGTLAGGIAHDFNNILTAILGNVEIARFEAPHGSPVHQSLDEVHAAARRARDLVRRILTFSRPHDQTLQRVDPRAVVEEVTRLLRASLPANVELAIEAAEALPAIVADASQIHQALMNLATNAWQAMEGDPGRITIAIAGTAFAPGDARPRGLEPGGYVRIDVADTGRGIPAALRERIFEPFFTTKEAGTGTGLGLAMVHGIMKAHRGAVTLESEPGRGTTFHLFFPAAPGGAASATGPSGAAPAAGPSLRLLFVDDEDALVRLALRAFERLGHRVTVFAAPGPALAAFQAAPQAYDALITDLTMPGMSGLELCRAALAVRPGLPMVLMSGRITDEDKEAARALGLKVVLTKPVTPEELVRAVARIAPHAGAAPPGI